MKPAVRTVITGAAITEALPYVDRLADAAMWLHGHGAWQEVCRRRRQIICGHTFDIHHLKAEVRAAEDAAYRAGMPGVPR